MGSYISNFDTTAEFAAFSATTAYSEPHVTLIKDGSGVQFIPYDPYNGHEYVEIGGLKWATMNIGATGETDYGQYFQWGDTSGYTSSQVGTDKIFDWAGYKYGNGTSSPGITGITKYNDTDGKTVLDLEDDAARANWGGSWRMPTMDEFTALSAATDFIDSGGTTISDTNKLTTLSGVTGILVADKNDHSKRLFFPAAGVCYNDSVDRVGSRGYYWSSLTNTSSVFNSRYQYFEKAGVWQDSYNRYYGMTVRPVLA